MPSSSPHSTRPRQGAILDRRAARRRLRLRTSRRRGHPRAIATRSRATSDRASAPYVVTPAPSGACGGRRSSIDLPSASRRPRRPRDVAGVRVIGVRGRELELSAVDGEADRGERVTTPLTEVRTMPVVLASRFPRSRARRPQRRASRGRSGCSTRQAPSAEEVRLGNPRSAERVTAQGAAHTRSHRARTSPSSCVGSYR